MRYYEYGYEKAADKELAGAVRIRTRFLPAELALYIVGSMEQKRRASAFLRRGSALCTSASDEFTLHFMCEQKCGVRIVRGESVLMSA